MNLTTYIPIVVLFVILYVLLQREKAVIAKNMIKKRKTGGDGKMVALARKFIGRECLVYAFDSNHQFQGIIREVSDHGILIERNGALEAINLDFVIRIREYPKNAAGKKKSVVFD